MKVPFVWTNHIDAVPQPKLFQKLYDFRHFPIISVSDDLRDYLLSNFNILPDDITVVHNGVDTSQYYRVQAEEKSEYKNQLNISDDEYIITLPGRLTYGKGHIYLVKAIEKLNEIYPDKNFTMLVAGNAQSNDEKMYLQSIVNEALNRKVNLKYVGFQNMRKLLSVSHIMCLPSLYECFGLVCAEAFLMKVPCVRSNSMGATDMKDICKVFQKENVEEFTAKLREIIDDKQQTDMLTEKAYKTATENFSVEAMSKNTIKVYEKIIG